MDYVDLLVMYSNTIKIKKKDSSHDGRGKDIGPELSKVPRLLAV